MPPSRGGPRKEALIPSDQDRSCPDHCSFHRVRYTRLPIAQMSTGQPLRVCDLVGGIVRLPQKTSDNRQLSEVIRVRTQFAQTGPKG